MPDFVTLPNKINDIFQNQPNDNWLLSENNYKQLQNYILILFANNLNHKIMFYNNLVTGFNNTTNGTEAHGLYIGLINDMINHHNDLANYLNINVPQNQVDDSKIAAPSMV